MLPVEKREMLNPPPGVCNGFGWGGDNRGTSVLSYNVGLAEGQVVSRKAIEKVSARQSVVTSAYEFISNRITSGHFGANERLTEGRLTEEIGVGRGAVREAMNKLAADGLIELVPNKGAIVRGITRKDMADFFQLRGVFESFAARRVAERINEKGVSERVLNLLREVENLEKQADLHLFVEHDCRFHAELVDLSANDIMSVEWRRLRRAHFRRAFVNVLTIEVVKASLKQHREILLSIICGDAETAAELGWKHVKQAGGRLQRFTNQEPEAVFTPSSS